VGVPEEIFIKNVSVWTRRDPFAEFDALIRNAFGPMPAVRATSFVPAAEARRDGDDAVVRLELPGLDFANDVTVEVDRGRLVVRGERKDERTEQEDGRTLREVRYGSFHRSFALPTHVTAEAVTAGYDAGILSVRVAGAYAGSHAHRIAVTAGTPARAVEPAETPAVEPAAESAE
jgi:HSP20 family molecular chaperone IbpA